MTERLYYNNPTLLEFEAEIVSVEKLPDNNFAVILNQSAFYPTSGGQSHDLGKLGEVDIIDVTENDNGDVVHMTNYSPGQIGDKLKGVVEPNRRKKHCQFHTAQHLLSQVFYRLIDGATVSVHLGEEYGAVEFEKDSISKESVLKAEAMVNQIISECVPIEIIFADSSEIEKLNLRRKPARQGKLRIIKIGDYEATACGGTHCVNTGQVQLVKLIGTEPIRKRTMIKFLAGTQAINDYHERFNISSQLTNFLTCGLADLPDKLSKLTEEIKSLKQNLTAAQKQLIPVFAEELLSKSVELSQTKALFSEISLDKLELGQQLSMSCADRLNGLAVLVSGARLFIACSKDCGMKAGDLMKILTSKTSIKGGGNDVIAQGAKADVNQLNQYQKIITEAIS